MTASHLSPGADDAPPPISEELRAHFAPLLRGTLLERCGMELLTLDARGGTATMPVEGNLQPAGLLHGGATIALAESIASFAAIHHRSARSGTVTATCSARHLGRQVASYLVDVHDEAGTLLSTITVSTQLLPPR